MGTSQACILVGSAVKVHGSMGKWYSALPIKYRDTSHPVLLVFLPSLRRRWLSDLFVRPFCGIETITLSACSSEVL